MPRSFTAFPAKLHRIPREASPHSPANLRRISPQTSVTILQSFAAFPRNFVIFSAKLRHIFLLTERKKCDSLEFGYSVTWDRAMDSAGIYSENGKGCGFSVKCTPVYPVRGLCPAGWHLPTAAEWDTLFYFVGDSVGFADPSSIALRSPHLWRVGSNSVGQDIFGFCALPSHKNRANFWTSEESSSREAENAFVSEHSVGHNWKYADPYVLEKVDYLAIRCVKD